MAHIVVSNVKQVVMSCSSIPLLPSIEPAERTSPLHLRYAEHGGVLDTGKSRVRVPGWPRVCWQTDTSCAILALF